MSPFAVANMRCVEITWEALLEGTLSADERGRVQSHVAGCAACRHRLAEQTHTHQSSVVPEPPFARKAGADAEPPQLIGRRYHLLGLLGQGGMGQVFRVLDRLTGQLVALKLVALRTALSPGAPHQPETPQRQRSFLPGSTLAATADGAPARGHLAALAQEFRTLATLRHPNIISVLDYGFDCGRPYFTMELLPEAQPLLPFAADAPQKVQLELLVQLLRALGYLHRRGVLHRDLKPSNILITQGPTGPTVKLLDFGLATSSQATLGQRGGTLLYMPPEVLLGGAATEASDLYAVGVMAYQMLVGRHPFSSADSPASRLAQLLHAEPDLSPLLPKLQPIIGRALSKTPEQRQADTASLLQELASALDLTLPHEPVAVRDSYLVAARFTGREVELQTLAQALTEARVSRGAAWLVGGESGVGKSRLISELRSLALIDGVLVVRGQAVANVRTAYQLWEPVLQVLALHVELDELEASVLGAILPNLAALRGRPVASPPELDAQGMRLRLLRVLRTLVERAPWPVLLLLEDLQWADAESLALLAQVSSDLGSRPLLIVASYRNDEAPRLPAGLPAMQVLPLTRLSRLAMAELCESMLGRSGRDTALLDLMERETEGNSFFVVEVLRALAEESGSLGSIGQHPLPKRVFTGGIENILGRRLLRVPAHAQEFLRLAAVSGRQLDGAALGRAYPQLDVLIEHCAEAGVLEMHEQRWHFSHDKLREQLLRGLDEKERCGLHERIAQILEEVYPGSTTPAAQVAHHYHQAAQLDKAARFYALAGSVALSRGAPAEAATALEQALALHEQLTVPQLEQVQVWRRLTQARYSLGELSATDRALRQVCRLAGQPLPTTTLKLSQALGRQLTQLAARSVGVERRLTLGAKSDDERTLRHEVMLALTVTEIYIWLSQPELMLLCTLWGLNLAAALGATAEYTLSRAGLALLLSLTPLSELGVRYLNRGPLALGTTGEIAALRSQTFVALHQGRPQEAADCAAQAVAAARAQKDA